ncbi:MAG: hypothetical protein KUG83_06230 [Gammaproteobacteria bacterium]|nr:hypothetical protein [Gammaproteobacteria bacterium]
MKRYSEEIKQFVISWMITPGNTPLSKLVEETRIFGCALYAWCEKLEPGS